MEPALKRHQLEDYVEAQLLDIAESLIPEDPAKEDLKAARDYFPSFFGGKFPMLGLAVTRTQGTSKYVDQPDRPGLLIVVVEIYYPALPVRGAHKAQDDRTGDAKRITRAIRGRFIEAIFAASVGKHIEVVDSRGSDRDEVGNARIDDRGDSILWIDRTELNAKT